MAAWGVGLAACGRGLGMAAWGWRPGDGGLGMAAWGWRPVVAACGRRPGGGGLGCELTPYCMDDHTTIPLSTYHGKTSQRSKQHSMQQNLRYDMQRIVQHASHHAARLASQHAAANNFAREWYGGPPTPNGQPPGSPPAAPRQPLAAAAVGGSDIFGWVLDWWPRRLMIVQ